MVFNRAHLKLGASNFETPYGFGVISWCNIVGQEGIDLKRIQERYKKSCDPKLSQVL
jgi:hypothetical protein